MTPEAIRLLSDLRREFYSRFATAMKVPVTITYGNSSTCKLSTAFWTDDNNRLNYLRVYAHTAPDELIPERPLILRISVNKGAELSITTTRRKNPVAANPRWHFELTLLPSEILGFIPWIVSFIRCHEEGSAAFVPAPPHPFDYQPGREVLFNEAWTKSAFTQGSFVQSNLQRC